MTSSAPPSLSDLLNGPNKALYSQLTQVLASVIKSRPAEPLKEFENLLADAASGANQTAAAPSFASESDAVKSRIAESSQRQLVNLGLKVKKPLNEDGEEPEEDDAPAEIPAFVPDLSTEFRHFRSVGVSLPSSELLNLQLNLEHLATHEAALESIRFWGKLFTLKGEYWVVEAKLSEWPEFEPPLDEAGEEVESRVEPWGTGPNEYIYFVNDSLNKPEQWTKLPLLTPEQIVASCGSRRFLTGDLNAPVYGFPRFPGSESSYLRSLIARIAHSTTVVPKGKFTADEEEVNIILDNEDFKGLSAQELRDARNWVHSRLHLLGEGRTEHFVEAEKEDEKEEEERKKNQKEREKEIPIPLLRTLAEDRAGDWKIVASSALDTGFKPLKATAKQAEAGELTKDHERDSHVTVSAQSNRWPGAVSVACGKFTQSVYIGWGLKALDRPYRPPGPPPMRDDFAGELVEESDPTEKPKTDEEEEEENEENEEKNDENEDEDD